VNQFRSNPWGFILDNFLDDIRAHLIPLIGEGLAAKKDLELQELIRDDREEGGIGVGVVQLDA
jgi:hypothetical protein